MCTVAAIAAKDVCCSIPLPQPTHCFSRSRSSLSHHIGLCGCVCGSGRVIPHTQEITNKSRENATLTCRQRILQAHRGTFEAGDTTQSALCTYIHQRLVCKVGVFRLRTMMAALPVATLFWAAARSYAPSAHYHDAAGSTAKDKSSHGPTGSCQDFCVLDHGDGGCDFASFAARTIRTRHRKE